MITPYPALLIPAYQPNKKLIQLIQSLRELRPQQRIIVVDDGSDTEQAFIFSKLNAFNVEVLTHPENQGKGQALKTGFKHWLETSHSTAFGIVTADADGQHLPQDILLIADIFMQNPNNLYLGVREFNTASTPWRSRVGNKITTVVLRLFTNISLQDTQTGLRAIPRGLMQTLLHSKRSGYDFELEMLLEAKENQIPIQQTPIKTVYLNGNRTSHFNPFFDSIKIYFVFLRFAAISLFSTAIDLIVFSFIYWLKKNIFLAVVSGRILSAAFNFKLNRHLAFKSQTKLLPAAIKYASLASFLALITYCLITSIHIGINIYACKIIVEIALFILSFTIQRLFIFNKTAKKAT